MRYHCIVLHWQSEESVKGYWLADSQLCTLKWSESEEWSMLLLPSFTWGFLSSYVLVALGFLRFFSRLAFSDDTTTLNNGLPNQQNGQQNAAPDAVEIPINLNLPATCSAVCFFQILAWLWNCPFLSADVTSEGRCYMSSFAATSPLCACSSTFSHLGLSENVVYPEKPNGFADHEIPTKWLAIIGGLDPIFRHIHLGIGSATETHSLSVLQSSSWRGWRAHPMTRSTEKPHLEPGSKTHQNIKTQ